MYGWYSVVFLPPNILCQGWFPLSSFNNLRVGEDSWKSPSEHRIRIFTCSVRLQRLPWDVWSATNKYDNGLTELLQYFWHIATVVQIYRRLSVAKSDFGGDLHLCWAHPPHWQHCQMSILLDGGKIGTGKGWMFTIQKCTLLLHRRLLEITWNWKDQVWLVPCNSFISSSYLPAL